MVSLRVVPSSTIFVRHGASWLYFSDTMWVGEWAGYLQQAPQRGHHLFYFILVAHVVLQQAPH